MTTWLDDRESTRTVYSPDVGTLNSTAPTYDEPLRVTCSTAPVCNSTKTGWPSSPVTVTSSGVIVVDVLVLKPNPLLPLRS